MVKTNKLSYKNTIIDKINWSNKNGKTFWKLLDKLDHKQDSTIFTNSISENKWVAHFTKIFQAPKDKLQPLPKNTAKQGPLDYDISDEEINLCRYILRNNKSSGYDSISNEMISCLLNVKPAIIKKLFNALLQNPIVINKWNTSLVSPVYKKRMQT